MWKWFVLRFFCICSKHFIFVIKKTKIYNHEISFLVSLSQNRNLQRYRYRILVEYLGLHWILVKCLIKFKTVEILDSFIQSSAVKASASPYSFSKALVGHRWAELCAFSSNFPDHGSTLDRSDRHYDHDQLSLTIVHLLVKWTRSWKEQFEQISTSLTNCIPHPTATTFTCQGELHPLPGGSCTLYRGGAAFHNSIIS